MSPNLTVVNKREFTMVKKIPLGYKSNSNLIKMTPTLITGQTLKRFSVNIV